MLEALKKQCTGVWRLQTDGSWRCIWRKEATDITELEGTVELFASMCRDRLEPGAEITAKMGAWMLMAQVDDDGILIGVRDQIGNPITIRTAMNMIEARSQGPAPRADVRASTLESPAIDSRLGIQSTHNSSTGHTHDSLDADIRTLPDAMFDTFSGGPHAAEERPKALAPSAVPTPEDLEEVDEFFVEEIPGAGLAQEESEGFSFEITFHDEPADDVWEDAHAAAEVSAADMAAQEPCRWRDVCAHVLLIVEQVNGLIGRRVAMNYWRRLIEDAPALCEAIHVDAARCHISPAAPHEILPAEAIEQMDRALTDWLARCSMVAHGVHDLVAALGPAPWEVAMLTESLQHT